MVSANSSITIRPAVCPPIVMSKKTLGLGMDSAEVSDLSFDRTDEPAPTKSSK